MSTSEQRTAKREARHRRLLKVTRSRTRPYNIHDCEDMGLLLAQCAYEAVSTVFAWLSVGEIRNPPRASKDAQLARQVAVRVMAIDLQVARRHVTRMQGRQRRSIQLAIQAVEHRMKCPAFCKAYREIAERAGELLSLRMGRRKAA